MTSISGDCLIPTRVIRTGVQLPSPLLPQRGLTCLKPTAFQARVEPLSLTLTGWACLKPTAFQAFFVLFAKGSSVLLRITPKAFQTIAQGCPSELKASWGYPGWAAPRPHKIKGEPQRGSSLYTGGKAASWTQRLQPTLGLLAEDGLSSAIQPRVAQTRLRLVWATLGYCLKRLWRRATEQCAATLPSASLRRRHHANLRRVSC